MAARTRICLVRPLLAGLVACGLIVTAAAMVTGCGLAADARPQTQPGPPVLTAYRLPAGGPAARPARSAAADLNGNTRDLAAAATAQPAAAAAIGGCAFWDVSCEIDSWFSSLIVSALKPLLGVVAQTGLSTPDLGSLPAVGGMWDGSAGIADTMFVLLILAGGIILMGYQTYQASYTLKEVAPRLVIAMVAANASLLFIPRAISLSNAISAALAPGLTQRSAASTLAGILASNDTASGIFLILLSLVAVALAGVVAVTYIIRLMAVVLLTGAAPLALACYALPHTSWAARWWWRAFAAALIIPDAQALVLTAAVKVFFSPGWASLGANRAGTSPYLLNILITICLLYVMMRIPFWVSRPALQPFGPSPVRRGLRFALGAVVLSRAGRALRGTSSAAAVAARRGNSTSGSNAQRGAPQHPAARTSRRGAAPRGITPGRPGGQAAAPGNGAPAAGSPPPGGGSPARLQAPPLPDGGTGHRARHALPPPLPYGQARPGTPPPLPGDPGRRRPVPPLPGAARRRRPVPPLPGGAARRAARPPLPAASIRPAQPSRRTPPPLPAARVPAPGQSRPPRGGARSAAVPPLPAAGVRPAQPSRQAQLPPLPAAITPPGQPGPPARAARGSVMPPLPAAGVRPAQPSRRTRPPLPAAGATAPGQRRQRPPLPGGTARRGAVPPLPAAGIRPASGSLPGMPSAGLLTAGLHAKPPPLPAGEGSPAASHTGVAPAPPQAGQPRAMPRASQEPATGDVPGPGPRKARPRPASRGEEDR
jgi:hypothetical protein